VEINASEPLFSSAELLLTDYQLPYLWIHDSEKKYRSHCQEMRGSSFGVMLTTALFIMLCYPACYLENKESKV